MQGWIIKYWTLLNQQAINDLLSILIKNGSKFPKDARTLLGTPKNCSSSIIKLDTGHYKNFGTSNCLKSKKKFKVVCSRN